MSTILVQGNVSYWYRAMYHIGTGQCTILVQGNVSYWYRAFLYLSHQKKMKFFYLVHIFGYRVVVKIFTEKEKQNGM